MEFWTLLPIPSCEPSRPRRAVDGQDLQHGHGEVAVHPDCAGHVDTRLSNPPSTQGTDRATESVGRRGCADIESACRRFQHKRRGL